MHVCSARYGTKAACVVVLTWCCLRLLLFFGACLYDLRLQPSATTEEVVRSLSISFPLGLYIRFYGRVLILIGYFSGLPLSNPFELIRVLCGRVFCCNYRHIANQRKAENRTYKSFFPLQFRREATVCATAPWSQKNHCGSPSKPGQGLQCYCDNVWRSQVKSKPHFVSY